MPTARSRTCFLHAGGQAVARSAGGAAPCTHPPIAGPAAANAPDRRSRARAPASSRAACYGLARASALAASIIASATHTPPSPRCEVSGRRRLRCCARYCDCYQPASPLLPRTFCSHTTPFPPLAHAHALAHAHRTPLHHPACCSTPGLDTRRSGPLTRNTPTRSKILATSLYRQ